MSKKFHKEQLCTGEMVEAKEQGRFGLISGWKCALCGKFLRYGVRSLHHKKSKGGLAYG